MDGERQARVWVDDVKLYLSCCRLDSADSAQCSVVDAGERPSRLEIGGELLTQQNC